jgi:hypothetical protein
MVAINALDGVGGLGKMALAVHVAHRRTARYTAISWSTWPGPARPRCRRRRGGAGRPGAAKSFLHVLRGKRMLLILDNVHDGDQVAPLLPPEDCALIVTSRRIAVTGAAAEM